MTFGDGFGPKKKTQRVKVTKHKSGHALDQITSQISPILPPNTKELAVIYETESSQQKVTPSGVRTSNCNSSGEFKAGGLLSFYNWPKIETSSVLQASKKDSKL